MFGYSQGFRSRFSPRAELKYKEDSQLKYKEDSLRLQYFLLALLSATVRVSAADFLLGPVVGGPGPQAGGGIEVHGVDVRLPDGLAHGHRCLVGR